MNNNFSLPYPHEKQLEYFLSPARYNVLNFGRRTGKSVGAGEKTFLKAIEKQGNYFIIAPTYTQAKSIYWNDIIKSIIPKEFIASTNEKELYVELKPLHYKMNISPIWGKNIDSKHDPNKPLSRIYLKGAENPDSLRGVSLDGAIIDEVSSMDKFNYLWEYVIRPALGDRQGWADFISTPDGVHGVFYELAVKAQDPENVQWKYMHATALDNPYFPIEEWSEQRRAYEREGNIDTFIQEWEAKFATPAKLVYKKFDRFTHVVSPDKVPRDGTYALAIDFGWNDPFATVFAVVDINKNIYIYDETYDTELDTDAEVRLLKMKMGDNHFTKGVADNANRTEIENLRKRGIPIRPTRKGKIIDGIKLVNSYLQVREYTGKPKLFVSSKCKNLIKEFESYEFLKDAWGNISDTPEDKNNHLLDALRYLIISMDSVGKAPPKATKRYTSNGRLIS